MRTGWTLLLCLVSGIMLAGHSDCDQNRYDLELKPDGDKLERTLTFGRIGFEGDKEIPQAFPADQLARIVALYPKRVSAPDALTHVLRGSFSGAQPADLGGAGQYVRLTSRMGAAGAYTERYCGNDDQNAQLAKASHAIDRLVDLWIGWFEKQLRGHEGLVKLRTFLDTRVRPDLKNLSLYAALAVRLEDHDPDVGEEMGARMVQYLVERDYLPPERIPEILSGAYRVEINDKATELMAMLQRLCARNMGVADDQPVPEALGFLADAERADQSLSAYLETTDAYKLLLERWQGERIKNPEATKPDPTAVLEPVYSDLLPFEILPDSHKLTAKLSLGVKPFSTNGQWQEKEGRVVWERNQICKALGLPTYLYAAWSEPDERFQKARFGKLALQGQALGEYVMWRDGLSVDERKAWDTFVDALRPGPELWSKVQGFRFSGEPAPQPEQITHSLADVPRRLLAPALEAK